MPKTENGKPMEAPSNQIEWRCPLPGKRPSFEPGFYTSRQEYNGRMLKYTIQSYAVQAKPAGERY